MTRLFLPRDAAALAVGADDVANAVQLAAASAGQPIEIVRTGSRGMLWLEPLLEVAPVLLDPLGDVAEPVGLQATRSPLRLATLLDQA